MDIVRKSSQEVEIDHLLAEEFCCDPTFARRFVSACGLPCVDLNVAAVTPEPSLGGEGFGDLLVDGTSNGLRVALLIEDKITAGPAVRQVERYIAHAHRMRTQGWDQVWTVLVAPAAYRGERPRYDGSVDLETVSELMTSIDPVRLAFRRAVIDRSLSKRASLGVKVPDQALHLLKSEYLERAAEWAASSGAAFSFPALRESYYDGDSWIEPIRHAHLPQHIKLRHRLWTSVRDENGQIDLIASPPESKDERRFLERAPAGATLTAYGKAGGIQLSIRTPEMSQRSGFNAATADRAFEAMADLVNWYLADNEP